jgi:hypothetical protein
MSAYMDSIDDHFKCSDQYLLATQTNVDDNEVSGRINFNNDRDYFLSDKISLKTVFSNLRKLGISCLRIPLQIDAEVIDVEVVKLNDHVKQKIPFLRNYSDTSFITFVEINMSNIVRPDALDKMKLELSNRAAERTNKARKRENIIKEEEFERYLLEYPDKPMSTNLQYLKDY